MSTLPAALTRQLAELRADVRNLQRERGLGTLNFRDLRDGKRMSAVEDGQVPVYRKASGNYEPGDVDDSGVGDPGTFLVTNAAGTARRWTTPTELAVSSTGKLLVGTASPIGARVDIVGAVVADGAARVLVYGMDSASPATGRGAAIGLGGKYDADNHATFAAIQGIKENNTSGNFAGALGFYTRVHGGLPEERGRFTSDGTFVCAGFQVPRTGTQTITYGVFSGSNDPVWLFGTSTTLLHKPFLGSQGYTLALGGGVTAAGHARPSIVLERGSSPDRAAAAVFSFFNDLDISGNYGTGNQSSSERSQFVFNTGHINTTSTLPNMVLRADGAGTGVTSFQIQAGNAANTIAVANAGNIGVRIYDGTQTNYAPIYASVFSTSSARETKRKIRALKVNATANVLALKPCLFERPGTVFTTKEKGPPTTHRGLVADEVVDIIPEAVAWADDKPMGLDYSAITATLIKAVQEMASRLDALEAK